MDFNLFDVDIKSVGKNDKLKMNPRIYNFFSLSLILLPAAYSLWRGMKQLDFKLFFSFTIFFHVKGRKYDFKWRKVVVVSRSHLLIRKFQFKMQKAAQTSLLLMSGESEPSVIRFTWLRYPWFFYPKKHESLNHFTLIFLLLLDAKQ